MLIAPLFCGFDNVNTTEETINNEIVHDASNAIIKLQERRVLAENASSIVLLNKKMRYYNMLFLSISDVRL